MTPVMEPETEAEGPQAIEEREGVLIAAAAAALLGSRFRILEIAPVEEPACTGWERRFGVAKPAVRAFLSRRARVRTQPAPQEENGETSDHA